MELGVSGVGTERDERRHYSVCLSNGFCIHSAIGQESKAVYDFSYSSSFSRSRKRNGTTDGEVLVKERSDGQKDDSINRPGPSPPVAVPAQPSVLPASFSSAWISSRSLPGSLPLLHTESETKTTLETRVFVL